CSMERARRKRRAAALVWRARLGVRRAVALLALNLIVAPRAGYSGCPRPDTLARTAELSTTNRPECLLHQSRAAAGEGKGTGPARPQEGAEPGGSNAPAG